MKINDVTTIQNNSNIKANAKTKDSKQCCQNSDINLNSDPKSFLGISLIKVPAWKKLEAKAFSTVTMENYTPAVGKGNVQYNYIQESEVLDEQKFHTNLSPKTLEIETSNKAGIDLMNLAYPRGTIGIATKLNKVISTSGMWQCAAVSFVNKKENTQVLVHLCPTIHKDDNENLIKYIMDNIPKKDLEISIAPGCYPDTDKTISFLVDTIKKHDKDAKIEFCNFPKGYERVVLENGKLKCIKEDLFETTERNPMDKIFYASTTI